MVRGRSQSAPSASSRRYLRLNLASVTRFFPSNNGFRICPSSESRVLRDLAPALRCERRFSSFASERGNHGNAFAGAHPRCLLYHRRFPRRIRHTRYFMLAVCKYASVFFQTCFPSGEYQANKYGRTRIAVREHRLDSRTVVRHVKKVFGRSEPELPFGNWRTALRGIVEL